MKLRPRSRTGANELAASVDMATTVGSVRLPNPVMVASGTGGHGAELGAYFDLSDLGAVVVKSLSADPWPGNPAPRVHPTTAGMLNSVGLQGPGVAAWIRDDLPPLADSGARVVASIWGRSIDDYRRAADALADVGDEVVAVEVNVSCPNVEDRSKMFAHSEDSAAAVIAATEGCGRPRWAKLSPNVTELVPIAAAVQEAGAEAVTLINTLMGLAIDVETRAPVLGAGGGGLSGPAIHPVAVRAVYEVHRALPGLPIVGVGGVASGTDAVEFLMAGACAVQVGTATFADPSAPHRIAKELDRWCRSHHIEAVHNLIGVAQ